MAAHGHLRVVAGSAKGRSLKVPSGEVRPTLDRVREALFSIIGPAIDGAQFLDLFAGSGANGIEALSRGAAGCTFVDASPGAIRCITENLERTGFSGAAHVIRAGLPEGLPNVLSGEPFDFVFADPPYGLDAYEPTIRAVAESHVLKSGGRLVVEHPSKRQVVAYAVEPLRHLRTYRYGESALTFFEHGGEPA